MAVSHTGEKQGWKKKRHPVFLNQIFELAQRFDAQRVILA